MNMQSDPYPGKPNHSGGGGGKGMPENWNWGLMRRDSPIASISDGLTILDPKVGDGCQASPKREYR